ncbi:MAG TPA: flagellar hook-basal body complex protein FliE [Allosphingosinicella sp.]|jgi:flagellar hook-basal body complex protein FliE
MSGIEAIAAASVSAASPALTQLSFAPSLGHAAQPAQLGFGEMLAASMRKVEGKVANANDMVRKFALDDSVPLHQVTFALEEARLSVELAMQVRGRLVETYRELMNMQL